METNTDNWRPSGNVGEWSELYVLSKLIADGGAFGTNDGNLRSQSDFCDVLEIFLSGNSTNRESRFKVKLDVTQIFVGDSLVSEVSRSAIGSLCDGFFNEIIATDHGSTFESSFGKTLLTELCRLSPSASSAQRASDLELILIDRWSGSPTPHVGFSIKSQIGSPSTLLNASGATNFEFEIIAPHGVNPIALTKESINSVQVTVKKLLQNGCEFRFHKMSSASFSQNLQMLDSLMVENVASLLINFYGSEESRVDKVSHLSFPQKDPGSVQKIFKIKQFLGAVAMGLRPSGVWDGDISKFKGMIVVKKNGDVILYYVHNLTQFQEFLFESVKFEVGSTSRHKFVKVYSSEGRYFIKLNLQIRFMM